MIIGAVDSAELSGLAVVDRDPAGRERLLWRATATIRTAGDVTAAVHALAAWSPDLVAVEEPFASTFNPITGMTLARLLGRWLQAFDVAGIGTVTIPASMWQPRVLPGFTSRMRSAERKVAAQLLARTLFGIDATADEADAVALAIYTARNATTRRQETRP